MRASMQNSPTRPRTGQRRRPVISLKRPAAIGPAGAARGCGKPGRSSKAQAGTGDGRSLGRRPRQIVPARSLRVMRKLQNA